MNSGMAHALAAMACFGVADFIYRRAAQAGIAAHQFLMSQAWLFCPAVLAYAAASGALTLEGSAPWGNAAGLLLYAGFYLFARSLRTGAVSINAPVFRLNFVLTAALAIAVLGEPLTVAKAAGLVAALVAAWLLLGLRVPAPQGGSIRAGALGQVLLATLAAGLGNFCHTLGIAGGARPATLVAAQAMVFASLATGVGWAVSRRPLPPPAVWRHAVPAAVVLFAAFLLFLEALRAGAASVVVPVTQMGFVPAALLGVMLAGETLTGRKVAGLLVATAALALLAAS